MPGRTTFPDLSSGTLIPEARRRTLIWNRNRSPGLTTTRTAPATTIYIMNLTILTADTLGLIATPGATGIGISRFRRTPSRSRSIFLFCSI
jgi:hypothetical protein